MSKRRSTRRPDGSAPDQGARGDPGGDPGHSPTREGEVWGAGARPLAPEESMVDRAGEDSFPASDAPPWTPRVRLGPPRHEAAGRPQEAHAPSIDRPLSGDVLTFELGRELEATRDPDILARSGRTARTLIKDRSLRVTIHLLAPGGEIREHHADGPITVQVLHGSMIFRAAGRDHELHEGQLLGLDTGIVHSVRSPEGAAFLLTVSLAGAGTPTH